MRSFLSVCGLISDAERAAYELLDGDKGPESEIRDVLACLDAAKDHIDKASRAPKSKWGKNKEGTQP